LPSQKQDTRTRILEAAEELMSQRGYHAVSMRDIAAQAAVNLGSVTHFFGTKENLLEEIYERHTRPMNQRRLELMTEAERVSDRRERLTALIRAFVIPAFSSSSDSVGGGVRFTRLRAILSMEGNETAHAIIARAFDQTSLYFLKALHRCLPEASEERILWRSHFLLGSLYYTLVNGDRITRLSQGAVDGEHPEQAVQELVDATVASLLELTHSPSLPQER
jgi:AcrR family transcriptional regulator